MVKTTIWLTGVLSSFILFFINKEIGMLYGCSLIVMFSSVMERNRIWAFLPAILVSWIWIYIGRGLYTGYSGVFSYSFRGVSLFPILVWPILDIFHGPWWMQVAYFLNGIIFFGIIILIEYKPYVKQK